MRITLIAVGTRMPAWVHAGFEEYRKRIAGQVKFELREVAPAKPGLRHLSERIKEDEAERILAAIPQGARVIALDEHGKPWTTRDLATRLQTWMQEAPEVVWLVGGSDGLAERCRLAAAEVWSLSALTLPHALVRVVLAEQLYRALSLTRGHPYHRE